MQIEQLSISTSEIPRVNALLKQESPILFQPDVQLQILPSVEWEELYCQDLGAAAYAVAWLPRGDYEVSCHLHDLKLPVGDYRLRLIVFARIGGERRVLSEKVIPFVNAEPRDSGGLRQAAWTIESAVGMVPIDELAWNRDADDWFFRHFDHAALVVTDYLLDRHELLKGRILDVGCGDGIIDLGIFLRVQPEELVGIDPFGGFDRLEEVITDNHLPPDVLDDARLQFKTADGNAIPYPDDYFDVVVSWGSLEHIAGGYGQTLREIRRVLKNDGLLFVHPGLYYGALGNHLGEFFDDPWIHLKKPEAELRDAVLSTQPRRIDRAGHVASAEEYWQWYLELNPIRVSEFERELRELGFEPWRVALRSSEIVEYSPELQGHAMQDLATSELYLSAWNRKPAGN
jgi:ubiquinone/menaquinone biosynthesis C-methylase UbiE